MDDTISAPASGLPADVRVYVNGRGVTVPRGSTALDAVRAADPAEADAVAAGERAITDSRGLPVPGTAAVHGGAVFRLVRARAGESA
jgi:hypothetical protein